MTIQEMKEKALEFGYTNEEIAMYVDVCPEVIDDLFSNPPILPEPPTLEILELLFSSFHLESSDSQQASIVREPLNAYTYKKKQGRYTIDDYYNLPEDHRFELIDGKLYYSSLGFSQEIGNMLIDKEGDQPNPNMSVGCLEGLCSGTAIVKYAAKKGLTVAHAGEFFELAAKGNEIAVELRNVWLDNMARGIGSLVNVLEPDLFVIGGGVIQSSEYFLEDLRKKVNDYVFAQMKDKVVIKLAHFDQDAGIIGAALLVR